MSSFQWTILGLSLLEIILLGVVAFLFVRLRRSENVLSRLQQSQKDLLTKLSLNEQLEKELVSSFADRQDELAYLDRQLRLKSDELKALITQAENFSRSPSFLRQTIFSGHGQGKSIQELAKATGLSPDEVEVILQQRK